MSINSKGYFDLNFDAKRMVFNRAHLWYNENYDSLFNTIKKEPTKYGPRGTTLFNPELWKPAHWRWFFEECQQEERF